MRSRRERERPFTAVAFLITLFVASRGDAINVEVEKLREELATTRQQLEQTQGELGATRSALEALARRVDAIQTGSPAQSTGAAPPAEITARLAPVNADNPSISFVVDTELAQDTQSSWESIGYPNGIDFTLQSAELFISAPIDPFARAYAAINASSEEGFDVEEAAIVSTALPWNLSVKGGRFFADFGRFPHWHNEALPFVDRPPSIERIIGGESISEGLEIAWLAPIEHFVELSGGIYNAVGAESVEALNDDGFFGRRDFDELNVLGRLHTYLDLTDTLNVELGATWLGIPRDSDRNLWGGDVTLRHQPGTSGFYQGLAWGTEWLWNHQRNTSRDDEGVVISRSRDQRQGGYTYVEAFLARRFSSGLRFDYSEAPEDDTDLARTVSAFVTWRPSEFQRLRFQIDNTWGDQETNQRFTLQWTAFIGSHVHGFAQR
jgi:hypothetical protein